MFCAVWLGPAVVESRCHQLILDVARVLVLVSVSVCAFSAAEPVVVHLQDIEWDVEEPLFICTTGTGSKKEFIRAQHLERLPEGFKIQLEGAFSNVVRTPRPCLMRRPPCSVGPRCDAVALALHRGSAACFVAWRCGTSCPPGCLVVWLSGWLVLWFVLLHAFAGCVSSCSHDRVLTL